MRTRLLARFGWALLPLLLLATRYSAAEEGRSPAIWYRASERCPSGSDFVQKLAENGHLVRLAQGGDHIDFVVTLQSVESQTVGRLERQTQRGTVAIRELRDATCERVTEALAFSLGLAVDPDAAAVAPAAAPEPTPEPEPSSQSLPGPEPEPVLGVVASQPAPRPLAEPRLIAVREPTPPARRWSLGLSLGALYGIATHPVLRGEAFATLDRVLSGMSFRLGVIGTSGSFSTSLGPVQRMLVAARGEACPVRLGGDRLALRPCLVSELGVTRVAQDVPVAASASSIWWAPGVGLRSEFELTDRVRLEAAAGALVPVPRHAVSGANGPLYQDAIIAFSGALGISLAVP